MRSRFPLSLAGLLTLLPFGAFASAVNVAGVVTDIGAQKAPVASIGGAVLLLIVAIKAFKWVRRAM